MNSVHVSACSFDFSIAMGWRKVSLFLLSPSTFMPGPPSLLTCIRHWHNCRAQHPCLCTVPLLFQYHLFTVVYGVLNFCCALIGWQLPCFSRHTLQWSHYPITIQHCYFMQSVLPSLYLFVWIWCAGAVRFPWDSSIYCRVHSILILRYYLVDAVQLIVTILLAHRFGVARSFGQI